MIHGTSIENVKMESRFSLLVSHILDKLGYNEEIRQYRISKYDDENFARTLCSHLKTEQIILAGSKAEGSSRIDESDFDILLVYSGVNATECADIVHGDSDLRLYMEGDSAPPGYCRLQLLQCGGDNYHHQWFFRHACYVTLPGYCRPHLCSKHVVSMDHQYWPGENEVCGPSSKGQWPGAQEMDKVRAIRCSHLPHSLKLWIKNHADTTWPSQQIMDQIAKTDVFLVPVGKHGGAVFLEWRISFNMAEKILIQNFTTVQYKVYILLKMIMKDVVEPNCPKSITSYIVKTLMLWAVEEIPVEFWRNEELLNLLLFMLVRLQKYVQCGFCPMYFIPEDNILQGRINRQTQQIISHVLSILLSERSACVLYVPRIARQVYDFSIAAVPLPLQVFTRDTVWEKTNILLNHARMIHSYFMTTTNRDMLIYREQGHGIIHLYGDLLTDLVSVQTPASSERETLVKWFANHVLSQRALQQCIDATMQHDRNSQKYSSVRRCMRSFHGICHTNGLSDRLRLAHVFYMLGHHEEAVDVLNNCAESIRYYMTKGSSRRTIQKFKFHNRLASAVGNECLSIIHVMKYYCMLDLQYDILMEPCLPKALKYEVYKSCDGRREPVRIDPKTLLHYLQFLCYTKLGEMRLSRVAFSNLVWCATKWESNIEYREVALNILGHILLKKGLYSHAARVLTKSIGLYKQYPYVWDLKTNAAVWHLAILLNKQQRQ